MIKTPEEHPVSGGRRGVFSLYTVSLKLALFINEC